MPHQPLTGKAALVTGASRGIGRAIANRLLTLGADVATIQRGTGPGRSLAADLSRGEDAESAAAAAIEQLGRLDICVCNAGIINRDPSLELSLDAFRDVLETNVVSAFAVSRAAARAFLRQGDGGTIVHVASVLAIVGGLRVAAYTASKGAVTQLARAQSNEWAPAGIRVNAVAAGYVETDMTQAIADDPARRTEITARIPLGRWARPQEVADAVVWLCLAESAYVTGTVLVVDGGFLAR
ncbi:MAG TPA: SDR family oxidoreductase [Gaiellaceae bacterium]|nr:SDR family oxidoreductase [Gaiellaceae bacterium]